MSAFGGKADSLLVDEMSAYDPKPGEFQTGRFLMMGPTDLFQPCFTV